VASKPWYALPKFEKNPPEVGSKIQKELTKLDKKEKKREAKRMMKLIEAELDKFKQ
jgi:hypothetical protein